MSSDSTWPPVTLAASASHSVEYPFEVPTSRIRRARGAGQHGQQLRGLGLEVAQPREPV